jgi:hypothetical protein
MDRCLDWEATSQWDNKRRTIARSYDDMPQHYLKSCFLDMTSFPEDLVTSADTLTRSWIAEGFVPHRNNQTIFEGSTEGERIPHLIHSFISSGPERPDRVLHECFGRFTLPKEKTEHH